MTYHPMISDQPNLPISYPGSYGVSYAGRNLGLYPHNQGTIRHNIGIFFNINAIKMHIGITINGIPTLYTIESVFNSKILVRICNTNQ